MEFLSFDDIREAILRPSLCFREARVFDSIVTKQHVVGRSLTENSTPVTREFPAGRKSGPIHGTLGNRCLCRCADVCQLAERILWTRILTSTGEISWLELNRRAFAIVRAIFDCFLGKFICFLSRLNDRRRVATRNVRVMFLSMAHYLIQSFVNYYLPLNFTYPASTILS